MLAPKVRLDVASDGSGTLYYKKAVIGPSLIMDRKKSITDAEVHCFLKLVDTCQFMSIPAEYRDEKLGADEFYVTADGDIYRYEGVMTGRYHSFTRSEESEVGLRKLVAFLNHLCESIENPHF